MDHTKLPVDSSAGFPLDSSLDPPVDSTASSAMTDDMLRQYAILGDSYDELRNADGSVRSIWRRFFRALQRLGRPEIERRWRESQQLIREHGIAYGAYHDVREAGRPWELDPFPLMISADDWEVVEAGLQQRAHLLELILADLHGPQKLITEGVLPARVLFSHPGFLRRLHGQTPRGGFLSFYAADLARGLDGRWWVLGDRSEAPSGVGYALENRVVISRMFPTEFREYNVRRLAPFFIALRERMQTLAAGHRDNPRVMILSPGPGDQNYFEDAYLARYLGYTLVEGADLTMRQEQVLLKTLGGLLPVDAIFRRIDSASCDPLELNGQSRFGVSGLLQAVRAGRIATCNALGSGLVESPIFMAFMPRLCEHLLGEPLRLAGVATWWCGEPESLTYVLENLDQLSIKTAFRNRAEERELTRQFRLLPPDELARAIQEQPEAFVAQESITRSSAPVWRGDDLHAAYLAVRTYVVATPQGYSVLPGGLARTSRALDSLEVSILAGEGSKDTWVMSSGPVESVSLLPQSGQAVELRRSGADLPSRVADNVFWLGRYMERADIYARVLRTVILRLTSETHQGVSEELPRLLRTMAEQGQIEPGYAVEGIREQLPSIDQALPAAVLDTRQSGSLQMVLQQALSVAGTVRDRLSVDSWRIVLRMVEPIQRLTPDTADLTALLNLSNDLVLDLAAFGGTVMESMTRTPAFRFLDIGRRLERGVQLIGFLQNCFVNFPGITSEVMEVALEVCDSSMTYRSRYLANLQLSAVLDLLLTDETNPRSLAYQLQALSEHIEALRMQRNQPISTSYSAEERLAMSMLHQLRMIDIQSVSEAHRLGDGIPLESLLKSIDHDLPHLSNALSQRYFVHAAPTQQLTEIEVL